MVLSEAVMLLDTSGLLCCFDADEPRQVSAVQLYDRANLRLTHNYVLTEFVALAEARHLSRVRFLEYIADIYADPEIEVIWVDPQLHHEALTLLQSQIDKTYSLCDAVSFVLMRQRKIWEALTTDYHFDQAGFVRLLER